MTDKLTFLVRADGGPSLGMGHLKKQRILTQALKLRYKAADFIFLIKEQAEGQAWLEKQGVKVVKIPGMPRAQEPAWIVKNTKNAGVGKAVLILDILDVDSGYVRAFKKAGIPVVSFENRGSSQKIADATVNAIVEGPQNKIINGRVFKGANYRIFHPDYSKVKKSKRAVPDVNVRFCVTMGGGDMKLSRLIARELRNFFPSSKVTVVEGPGNSGNGSFREKGMTVLKPQESLAKLFQSCNFAVTAGGGTLYETALSGLPAAAFALKKHQVRNIKFFAVKKSVLFAGMLNRLNVKAAMPRIKKILQDKNTYSSVSKAGRKIADGKGLERIVKIIQNITEKIK